MKSAPGIVFHPSVAPHVRETVLAFDYQDLLQMFFTSLYWGRSPLGSFWDRLPEVWQSRARRRRVPFLDEVKVHSFPFWESLRLAIPGPPCVREPLSDLLWEQGDHAFSQHLARRLPEKCGFVYGYDHSSLEVFRAAKTRRFPCIYEVPSLEWDQMQTLTRQEMTAMGQEKDFYLQCCERHHIRRTQRCRQEWDLADLIIVNSEVTRQSFAAAGYDTERVRVVPLGAPPASEDSLQRWSPSPRLLRLIWVGPFTPRKGARILREALSHPLWPAGASIDVFGSVPMPGVALNLPADRIRWHGTISQEKLWHVMSEADALLLPTLADGFGMALTEAWSQGLPVITTDRAGAAELMTHQVHGIKFHAGSVEALLEALHCFSQHRPAWPQWRVACLELARKNSWTVYHEKIVAMTDDYRLF
ncbi:MAG: glycosyltransferase family 4 protein [Blastochloris sp.]|nr:glycosyltransferase family 4 protein [Blastochloris sp.]